MTVSIKKKMFDKGKYILLPSIHIYIYNRMFKISISYSYNKKVNENE